MGLFGPPNIEKMKARKDVNGLIKALHYRRDSTVRGASARALGSIGDARAVGPLITVLNDSWPDVRGAAAEVLGTIGDPRAVDPLVAALGDSDAAVRRASAEALGTIGDPRAVEPLVATISDSNAAVRGTSTKALRSIGDPRAVELLIAALNHSDQAVSSAAAKALGNIGDSRAIEPLAVALQRTDEPIVRECAAAALDRLGRKPARAKALGSHSIVGVEDRYKCNSCDALQADGEWERVMDARAKAMGMKGFINISSPPECLRCGSTDLDDLLLPEKRREQVRRQKASIRSRPEYAELLELLARWESDYSAREQIERRIRGVGVRLAEHDGRGLMYDVCTSIDRKHWQNVVSSCWDGIAGWMH